MKALALAVLAGAAIAFGPSHSGDWLWLAVPPLIAAAIAYAIPATATIIAGTVTVAQVLAYVVWTAAMAGAAYLVAQGAQPKSQPLKRTLKAPAPPRWGLIGRTKSAGWAFCYEAKGSLLAIGLAFCTSRISEFTAIYVDDREIELAGGGTITGSGLEAVLFMDEQLGAADQTASGVLTTYVPEIWTSDHRNRGVATLNFLAVQVRPEIRQTVWPNGFPEVTAILQAAPIRDPRDVDQEADDEGTWEHLDDNAALGLLHWFQHPDGGRRDIAWISVPSFEDAADDCDRAVAKYGSGTEPWARASGIWSFEEEQRATIARFQAACDGEIYEDGDGDIAFRIAAWEEPEVVITDDHILYLDEVRAPSMLTTVNDLTYSWVDPARGYEPVEGAPIRDQDSIDLLGRLSGSLPLDLVQWGSQAYRMAVRHFRRQNPPSRLNLIINAWGLACYRQRVVRVTSVLFGIDAVFAVRNLEPQGGLHRWSVAVDEVTEAMFEDVVPPADPSRSLPSVTPPTIPVPSLSVSDIAKAGLTYLRADAGDPSDDSLTLEVEYRRDSETDADYVDYETVITALRQDAGPVSTGGVDDIYLSRARWITAAGLEGTWCTPVSTDLS